MKIPPFDLLVWGSLRLAPTTVDFTLEKLTITKLKSKVLN